MRIIVCLLVATLFTAAGCKKETALPPAFTCDLTDPISIDTGDAYFVLPTAFTPNGDGRNDNWRALSDKVSTENFLVRVYKDREVVFETTDPYFVWSPEGYTGARREFEVDVRFHTIQGAQIATCINLTVPKTDSFFYCAENIAGLFFMDQIDIVNGEFLYPTGEQECP